MLAWLVRILFCAKDEVHRSSVDIDSTDYMYSVHWLAWTAEAN